MLTDAQIRLITTKLPDDIFLSDETAEKRVQRIYEICGVRLPSHVLATLWAEWLSIHPDLPAHQRVKLAKEILLMIPYHEQATAIFNALFKAEQAAQSDAPVIFMITSCQKYLPKALALRQSLARHGASALIMTGNPSQRDVTWTDAGCVLPISDSYEALPLKVAYGIASIVERYGPCIVVKIDDDCALLPQFDVATFRKLAASHAYTGVRCGDPFHDRAWHIGKTSTPTGLYTRRFRGPWARGACYTLSPEAVLHITRDVMMFPGEFACEAYEDKAIGDALRTHGIVVHDIVSDAAWGITVDMQDRPATNP